MSVNPCADALLVRLVAPGRVAAISHYSHDPQATSLPIAVARRFAGTGGTAEEVIALRPSLVLASTFTPAATRDAYARAGLRTLYLDSPTTVAASIAQVRAVAAATGEPRRGEAMAAAIEAAVGAAPLTPPRRTPGPSFAPNDTHVTADSGPRLSPGRVRVPRMMLARTQMPAALLFIAGDLANGSGTLLDELLTRAGFRNAAADYGLSYSGRVPLERLVAQPPAVVIGGGGRSAELRRRLLPSTPQVDFPRALINCGGPAIVPALARLRAIRASLR